MDAIVALAGGALLFAAGMLAERALSENRTLCSGGKTHLRGGLDVGGVGAEGGPCT